MSKLFNELCELQDAEAERVRQLKKEDPSLNESSITKIMDYEREVNTKLINEILKK